jgi:hypothetical protein
MSESRPRYEIIDSPALAGLGVLARIQVAAALHVALLAEIVDQAGGDVILPAGFRERVANPTRIVETRFLEDGSYRVWTSPLTPEFNHPGAGTRWERLTGPRRDAEEPELWEVDDMDDVMVTLQRITPDGQPIAGVPLTSVRTDYLRRGIGGWRRWVPPLEVIEGLGGRNL